MSRQIQIRRGTAAQNDAFTGAVGEVTMDTTNKTLRVHDGETAGGIKLAKQSEIPEIPTIHNFIPDYANGTIMAANTIHTAPSNGWVYFYQFANGDRYFNINGTNYKFGAGNGYDHYSGSAIMVPIAKGQTFSGAGDIIFFPCATA